MQADLFKMIPVHQNENLKAAANAGKTKTRKGTKKNETRFKDVLRSVSRSEKQSEKPNKSKEMLNNKLVKVENKLKKMLQKASPEEKQKLKKLLTMLKNIKLLIEGEKDKKHGIKTSDNTEFLANLSHLLDEISAMIDKNNKNMNFKQIETKLETIDNSLKATNHSDKDNHQVLQTKTVIMKKDEKAESEPKVKIRDLRRKTKEHKSVQKKMQKSAKKNPRKTPVLKTQDKAIARETALNSETRQNGEAKFLRQQVGKQYVSYSSPVSRANLEAMMSGITGKALVTLRNGKSELKMQLFPPELGRMSMKFTLKDGVMVGKIVVATADAKMLFDQNLSQLQQSLANAGVNVSQLNVSVGGESGDSQQELFDGQAAVSGISENGNSNEEAVVVHSLFDSSVNYIA